MIENSQASLIRRAGRWAGARRALFALAFTVVLAACSRGEDTASHVAPQPGAATAVESAAASSAAAQNSYADVVARVAPAVVTVRAERRTRAPQQHPFMDDPFFREFFGDRIPRQEQTPRRQEGLGSGVIVSSEGHVLTNYHVVDGAEQIEVELTDRRVLRAKIVGGDQPSDLAVLKVDVTGLPVLPLGNSDEVRVGDVVLAVGNPLGIGQTVTSGIVSAKGRSTGLGDGSFADFIQTDAAINRGNSGGALVNTAGQLVGINSQILSPTGGNIGIGFAIPSNMAKSVMEQLLKAGKVRRGQLGVTVQTVTSDIAQSLELREIRGALVNSVAAGSAAERAGLRQGDVITGLNGQPVTDHNELRNRIAGTQPDTEVTLNVIRDGREQQLRARLGEYQPPAAEASGGGGGAPSGDSTGRLGVTVRPLTPEVAQQLNLRAGTQGLVVGEVDPAGPAAEADIRGGDVIEQVNRQPVRTADDLAAALQRAGARPVLLLVNRRGTTFFVTVRPRQ